MGQLLALEGKWSSRSLDDCSVGCQAKIPVHLKTLYGTFDATS